MEDGFRGYHPFVQFTYYMATSFLAIYLKHPFFLAVMCLLVIGVNLINDGGKALKRWIPIYVLMGSIIVLLNPFLVSRGTNILFYFRGKQVTLEAFTYGIVMALSIITIMMMFVSFNLILNGNRFLFLFGRILPRTAFLLMLAIRFVPLLRERLTEINAVQRIKGLSVKHGTIRQRAKSGMAQMQILLTWSMEEAIQTADSMKARGYGSGKKTSYMPYHMDKRDWGWLAVLLCLFAVCIAGGSLGYGKIIIYPELGTLQLYMLDWVLLAAMILLASFPIISEGREYIRWKW